MTSKSPLKWRHFLPEIILWGVRWCCLYPISYRQLWDGAGYHSSDEVKEFLASVNDCHEPNHWQTTCIRFAPNAPEQNPVEDVWLQTKNFLIKFWTLGKSFTVVKWLFKFFTNHQEFYFSKLHQYAPC